MDGKEQDKVMAFDTLFTTNHIQMMKVLMTYLDPYVQKSIAIYIKIMELQYTLSFFRIYPGASVRGLPHEEAFSTEKLLDELLPYCTPSEQSNMARLKNMLQSMSGMQEMMQLVQSLKDIFPEGEGALQGDMSGILSALGAMEGISSGGNESGGGSGIDISQIISLFQAMKE